MIEQVVIIQIQPSLTQKNINGTRNLTQQVIQTPSNFVKEQKVKTMPTTK